MKDDPVYLDYNGTTPLSGEVFDAMLPFLKTHFGNPSSSHWYGIEPARAIRKARKEAASLLNCSEDEIIFTGGGTESNNHVLRGIPAGAGTGGRHIITSSIEHPSVLEVCRYLESSGYEVTCLPVDSGGFVDPDDVRKAIRPHTSLISVMHANNETGTIEPIARISEIAREHGIPMHTDAAQSAGKISVDVNELGVDFLSLAGHKLYAPKGVGILYVRRGTGLCSLIFGASQEGGRRPGTENVASICAMGTACRTAADNLVLNHNIMKKTRDLLLQELNNSGYRIKINTPENSLPNTLSVSFYDIRANDLLEETGHIFAASAGAACHSDSVELSHVLQAMGVRENPGMGTIRFSTGRMTTEEEILIAADCIKDALKELRP